MVSLQNVVHFPADGSALLLLLMRVQVQEAKNAKKAEQKELAGERKRVRTALMRVRRGLLCSCLESCLNDVILSLLLLMCVCMCVTSGAG